MKISRLVVVLFALLVNGHTQGSPDFYIASLQMPCYPPLARQAKVQGQVKVRVEVGKDGTVTLADALEGNPMLQAAALPNSRTWKFGGGQGADLSTLKTTIVFDYRLEGEAGWERCAARVIFDSFNKVEIIGHPPVPINDSP
ncbi:MAG TPA: TonB family protein [Terriglobales bacterium]|nr:TonB family protein [Terriglobales bacterium]